GMVLKPPPLGTKRADGVLDEADLPPVAPLATRAEEHGRMDFGLLLEALPQVVLEGVTPSPNWSGHLGEVMLNLFEEEENGGISQGRRWAPAVHDRLQEGADRPRPPGRDYAFGACA